MKVKRTLLVGATFVALLGMLAIGQSIFQRAAAQAAQAASGAAMAPKFEVDPLWPQGFPDGMTLGQTIGVAVDANDHVWIVHRPDVLDDLEAAADNKTGLCCKHADPIMEFDQAGKLMRHWGGKDGPNGEWKWPASNHGIWVDKGMVYIGGNGGGDGHILKFTVDGKFVKQFGKAGVTADSNATDHFYMVAKIHLYPKTNELFVADGYGNHRVAVINPETGAMIRYWGAYGKKPTDVSPPYTPGGPLPQNFRTPVHCAEPSNDGFVYVCDRTSMRMQVFKLDGTFVSEHMVMPESGGDGTTWDVEFSKDPAQRFLYLADGRNQKVHIYDRKTMVELTNFGTGGHYPGQWYSLHSLAVDSKGNLYTTETYQGRRVQKFTYKGLAPVTKKMQGAAWPGTTQ